MSRFLASLRAAFDALSFNSLLDDFMIVFLSLICSLEICADMHNGTKKREAATNNFTDNLIVGAKFIRFSQYG